MNKRRLLKLADFLETVPRKVFDMGKFAGATDYDYDNVKRFSGEFNCGFAGCAMGWAAHGRLFRGLSVNIRSDKFVYQGKGADGFHTGEVLFGIDSEQAYHLFAYTHEETPKQVAKRIRKFVASNGTIT